VNKRGCPGDTVRAFVWIRNGLQVDILGPNKICYGEEVTLRASGAQTLRWNNGSASPVIKVKPEKSMDYFAVGYSEYCGLDTAFFHLKVLKKPIAILAINPYEPQRNQ